MTDPTNFDELLAQADATPTSFDELVARNGGAQAHPASQGAMDYLLNSTGIGHTLQAFGEGAKGAFGSETEKALRGLGVFNDYEHGQTSIIRSFNEAILLRPAQALAGLIPGLASAAGDFVSDVGKIDPVARALNVEKLGEELKALPDAFMGSPGALGVPHPIAEAADLGVIGKGEAGWKGTADERFGLAEATKRLAPSDERPAEAPRPATETAPAVPPETPSAAPEPAAPDVNAVARQVAPQVFREFDALATRRDTFRRWIDELAETRDREATAALDAQIADTQSRLEDATGKRAATYRSRLADLQEQRDAAAEAVRGQDSDAMARIRAELQKTDFRMRDLAPDVSAAYREAERRMPADVSREAGAGTEPTAEPTPVPDSVRVAADPRADDLAAVDNRLGVEQARFEGGADFYDDAKNPRSAYAEAMASVPDEVRARYVAHGISATRGGSRTEALAGILKDRPSLNAGPLLPTAEEAATGVAATRTRAPYVLIYDTAKPIEGARPEFVVVNSRDPAIVAEVKRIFPNETVGSPAEIADRMTGAAAKPANPAEPKPAPVEAARTASDAQAKTVDIAADVARQLVAAGRPAEEASAAGQLVAAHYQARAARFEGRKGGAGDLYAAEAPTIRAGGTGGRKGAAAGKTALRDGRTTITLFAKADASTFIHETGHHWLEELLADAKDARAPESLRADAATVRKWLGAEGDQTIPTRAHEKFARGFERYLMEGVAPSRRLASVFAQFKDWLTRIYETVQRLSAPITDDIRDVYARLIAPTNERVVVASEREPARSFADRHETIAAETPAPAAHAAAETVRGEIDSTAKEKAPEVHDELNPDGGGPRIEAGGVATPDARPAGGADAARPVGGPPRIAAEPGAVAAGGNEAPAQGAGARKGRGELSLFGKVPAPPPSLVDFIKREGGLKDDHFSRFDATERGRAAAARNPSELRTIGAQHVRGLVRPKTGLSLELMAEKAHEAGYFPELGPFEPGNTAGKNDLLAALADELGGKKRYSEQDHAALQAHRDALAENEALADAIDHFGIDAAGKTRAQVFDELAERQSEAAAAKLAAEHAAAFEEAMREAEDARVEWLERHGEETPVTIEYGTRTLEDLEREFREESDAAARPRAGSADDRGSEPPGPREGGGETGDGSRGDGAGPGRRADASSQPPAGPNQRFGAAGSGLVDKAGNIRLDNLGTPEDVNTAIREAAAENDDFTAARRGLISDGQVLDLADALGMDPGTLSARKLGQAFNAEQIVAARKLLIESATTVRDAMVRAAEGSDADVLAYAEAKARHRMIQEQVAGITAEAGRALRAFRALEGGREAAAIGELVEKSTGRTLFQLRQEAKLGAALETPAQVSRHVADMSQTRFQKIRAGVLSYFINNLISGPLTHAGYSVGNTVMALFKATVETPAAAAIGRARELVAGAPVERVHLGEAKAQLYGIVRGMRDGFAPGVEALKTGVSFMKGAEDAQGRLGLGDQTIRPQTIPGKVGYVLETPSRAVSAIHTVFYSMNYEAEIATRAYRTATEEGLTGAAFSQRVAELTQRPAPEVIEAAHAEALKMVLMQRPAFGSAAYHLQRAVNNNFIAKLIMPFMQIGGNLLREGYVERSLVGIASQRVRDNLAGRNGAVARDAQMARIGVGTGLAVAVIGFAAEELMTGSGPSDPHERQVKEMTGWKPYSVRIGDEYIPYRKFLGPLGPLVAGVADLYELGHTLSAEGLGKAALGAAFGFAEVVADESWMKGLSDFINALRNWDRDGGRYLRNLSMDFLPFSVGIQQVAHTIDPYRRQVRSELDAVKTHIPGLSQGLFPVRDLWGNPIAGGTMMSPSAAKNDPVAVQLQRAEYFPAPVERKIRGVELTDRQYDDFSRTAGRLTKMRLDAMVSIPGFEALPLAARRQMMKDAVENSREAARSLVMMENPSIIERASEVKRLSLTEGPKAAKAAAAAH